MGDTNFTVALLGTTLALLLPGATLADDPLNAFPTEKLPAEERVQKLTETERKRITLPDDGDQIVFSISTERQSKPESGIQAKPWLRVFADGQIEARPEMNPTTEYCKGRLNEAELVWLLHLAVNECHILTHTTKNIDAAIAQQKNNTADAAQGTPNPSAPGHHYRYEVDIPAGRNRLSILERALVLQPLRARLKLVAFGSLNKYARFLVARTCLGNEAQREAILQDINAKLQEKDVRLPPFKLEHLGASGNFGGGNFAAVFRQEHALAGNRYRKVTGIYQRKEGAAKPEITINSLEFEKYRPE